MTEIVHISKVHSVEAAISIGFDNKGAVDKLNRLQVPVSSNTHHFDLFQTIQQIVQMSQMKFSFHWIKGHQDDNKDSHTLSRDEYLNVIVDSMAQALFNQKKVEGVKFYQVDNLERKKKCSIKWGNNDSNSSHIIQSLLGKTLRQIINSQNTKEYVIYKKKIEPNDISHLDWDQLQYSIIGMTRNMQIWLSKWITCFMGTMGNISA